MRIAVIGSGIAGLASAWLLRDDHATDRHHNSGKTDE